MGMHLQGVDLQLRRLLGTAEQRLAESPETAHRATCRAPVGGGGGDPGASARGGEDAALGRGEGTLPGFASNGTGPEGLCRASLATEQDRRDSAGLR